MSFQLVLRKNIFITEEDAVMSSIEKNSVGQTSTTNNDMVSSARKYITSIDIHIDSIVPDEVSIKVTDGDTINVKSPMHFEIGEDRLVSLYSDLNDLGLPGKLIAKALVDAINEIDSEDKLIACTNATPMSPIQYFRAWCTNLLYSKRMETYVSRKQAWRIMFAFRGYKGLKAIFTDGLKETISELKRVKHLEETL
jgi:hypothetical protein